jgi:hypothetical protein
VELEAKRVFEILKQKGVAALYHANTVQTACSFLQQGSLLARGVVEERGLIQTPQASDESDKKHGIWYDIFVDAFDIHRKLAKPNAYGPVLFVLDIELLSEISMPPVWVTKTNPAHWGKDLNLDRYFATIEEFVHGYQKLETKQQFMLRHIGGVLTLAPHLRKMVVDDPGVVVNEINIYDQALGGLKASARAGGLTNLPMERRQCKGRCACRELYKSMSKKHLTRFFEP